MQEKHTMDDNRSIAEDLSHSGLFSEMGAYRYTAVELLARIRDLEEQRVRSRNERPESLL